MHSAGPHEEVVERVLVEERRHPEDARVGRSDRAAADGCVVTRQATRDLLRDLLFVRRRASQERAILRRHRARGGVRRRRKEGGGEGRTGEDPQGHLLPYRQ